MSAVIMLTGRLILESRDQPTLDLAGLLWRNLAIAALLGALGVGIGGLLRNQIATVVGSLVVALALEPTLLAQLPDIEPFGPLIGAPTGILGVNRDTLLAPGLAALVSVRLGQRRLRGRRSAPAPP